MRATAVLGFVVLFAATGCTDSSDDAPTAGAARSPAPAMASPTPAPTAQPSEAITVFSEDGALVLTIPEGALREGVEPVDIRITAVEFAAPPTEDEPVAGVGAAAPEVVAAFELHPSGTRFLRPVALTFRFRLPRPAPDAIRSASRVIAFHVSDGGVELLELSSLGLLSRAVVFTASIERLGRVVFAVVQRVPGEPFATVQ